MPQRKSNSSKTSASKRAKPAAASRTPRKPRTRFTLLRQWETLKALPAWPSRKTYVQIARELEDAGYAVDPNTVRRDLDELSGALPIEIEQEGRNNRCGWMKGADTAVRAMSVPEALALRMVEQYLAQLLPATVLDVIQAPFNRATQTLAALKTGNATARWIDKVRAVPPTQPMAPPHILPEAQAVIHHALMEGQQIRARYRTLGNPTAKEYTLHPLGLILRTPSVYLVATAWNYKRPEDVQLYALHRFDAVEVLDSPVRPPKGFNLDKEIERGLADFGERGEPIEIELLVSAELAAILEETPLAVRGTPPKARQTITKESDGRFRVKALVNDTWQLRWWLLAQGEGAVLVDHPSLDDETPIA